MFHGSRSKKLGDFPLKCEKNTYVWSTFFFGGGRVIENYSRVVFSIRKDALTVCVGRWMTAPLESRDPRTVGFLANIGPWSRRKSCLPASWQDASTAVCLRRCSHVSRTVAVLQPAGRRRRRSDAVSCLLVRGSPRYVSSSSRLHVNQLCDCVDKTLRFTTRSVHQRGRCLYAWGINATV